MPRAVVINRAMAERYWPGAAPIHQRITVADCSYEVVGIAGDVHQFTLDRAPEPALYLAHSQAPAWMRGRATLMVRMAGAGARSAGDVGPLTGAVRAAIWEVDATIPVSRIRTMEQVVAATVAEPRFRALLLLLFAGVALALGAAGIYGVVSYVVAQRTHELGIRLMLGATAAQVIALVVRQAMAPVALGLAIGLAGALALGRALAGLLFGVGSADPLTFAATAAVLLAAALLACWLPARRVARWDPLAALRIE